MHTVRFEESPVYPEVDVLAIGVFYQGRRYGAKELSLLPVCIVFLVGIKLCLDPVVVKSSSFTSALISD